MQTLTIASLRTRITELKRDLGAVPVSHRLSFGASELDDQLPGKRTGVLSDCSAEATALIPLQAGLAWFLHGLF